MLLLLCSRARHCPHPHPRVRFPAGWLPSVAEWQLATAGATSCLRGRVPHKHQFKLLQCILLGSQDNYLSLWLKPGLPKPNCNEVEHRSGTHQDPLPQLGVESVPPKLTCSGGPSILLHMFLPSLSQVLLFAELKLK